MMLLAGHGSAVYAKYSIIVTQFPARASRAETMSAKGPGMSMHAQVDNCNIAL
jgi:hypothetical protein